MARVVELRVHGVGGPTPDHVLETVEPKPVEDIPDAVDDLAGFYRREEAGPAGQDVEALVWGGLTSKTAAQAAWWLLLPFSLVNVAGWMIREGRGAGPDGHELRGSQVWWIRLLLSIAGMLLTAVYLLWSAVALVDVVAYQCGAQARCVDRSWLLPLRWFGGHPLWRVTVGLVALAAVLLAVLLAARITHKRYEEYETDPSRRKKASEGRPGVLVRNDNLKHPGFWYNWQAWRRLYNMHALAAFVVFGLVVGFAVSRVAAAEPLAELESWGAVRAWAVAAAVLVLGAGVWMVRPARHDDSGRNQSYAPTWWALSLGLVSVAVVGAFIGWGWHNLDATVDLGPVEFGLGSGGAATALEGGIGINTAIAWFFTLQVVVLVPALILVWRNYRKAMQRPGYWRRFFSLTPAIGDGFRVLGPAVTATAGFAIANAGFGAAIVRLIDLLDRGEEMVTFGTPESGFLASPGLAVDIFVFGLLVGLVLLVAPLIRSRLGSSYAPGVAGDYADMVEDSARRDAFLARVARGRTISQIGRSVDRFLTGLTVGILIASGIVFFRLLAGHEFADVVQPWLGFGGSGEQITDRIRDTAALALILFVFPGAMLVRAGARNRGTRRQVGKVWDSITFFPRRFHPLGAPCYAERAVPMLREYIRTRVQRGERVVIHAHSQGTVLSLAALAQLVGEEAPQEEIVTIEEPERSEGGDEGPGGDGAASPGGTPSTAVVDAEDGGIDSVEQRTYLEVVHEVEPGKKVGREVLAGLGLVTLGSPLGQLHAPFFPVYFHRELFEELRGQLGGRWHSYYRETDYIGKWLFVDPDEELTIHGLRLATGERPAAPDHSLVDPTKAYGKIEAHSYYERRQEVQETLAAMVERLRGGG